MGIFDKIRKELEEDESFKDDKREDVEEYKGLFWRLKQEIDNDPEIKKMLDEQKDEDDSKEHKRLFGWILDKLEKDDSQKDKKDTNSEDKE